MAYIELWFAVLSIRGAGVQFEGHSVSLTWHIVYLLIYILLISYKGTKKITEMQEKTSFVCINLAFSPLIRTFAPKIE